MRWENEPKDLNVMKLRCEVEGDVVHYKGHIQPGVMCFILPSDELATGIELVEDLLIAGVALSQDKPTDGQRFYAIKHDARLHKHNGPVGTLTRPAKARAKPKPKPEAA